MGGDQAALGQSDCGGELPVCGPGHSLEEGWQGPPRPHPPAARSWASLLCIQLSAWPSPMTSRCAPSPACPAGCPGMACEWLGAPAPASAGTKGSARVTLPRPPSIHLTRWAAAAGKDGATLPCSSPPLAFFSLSSPPLGAALGLGWNGEGVSSQMPPCFLSYFPGPASLSWLISLTSILTSHYVPRASFRVQGPE